MHAVVNYTLHQPSNEAVQSVNALVGETNDGYLNDIRGQYAKEGHVLEVIQKAQSGPVAEEMWELVPELSASGSKVVLVPAPGNCRRA